MSDTNGNDAKSLRFEENHRPGLAAGDYRIKLEQWIPLKQCISLEQCISRPQCKTLEQCTNKQAGAATYAFSIAAPRFSLNPQDVSAVFPPTGSLGDHSNVLPHIQLQRSTLPWERQPHPAGKDGPWLALLVLREDELGAGASRKIQSATITLDKLQTASEGGDGIWWHGVTLETRLGQHPQDAVSIIDVDANLLKKVFPGPAERKWLAHVRYKIEDQTGRSCSEERAVIIGNRLPASGGGSVVYLVSLEGRDVDDEIKKASDATGSQKVRFVSLHSWRFDCISHTHSFTGLLLNLNRTVLMNLPNASELLPPGSTIIPEALARAFQQIGKTVKAGAPLMQADRLQPPPAKDPNQWVLKDGVQDFHLRLERNQLTVTQQMPGVLRLPSVENADAKTYLRRGAVALPHATRLGNRTVSWYHGPFVPGSLSSPPISFPIEAADKVLHYNSSIGMLDVSYAAAWELGRLLTLQNKPVAAALYNWKRRHAQADKLLELEDQWLHLPFRKQDAPADLPSNVIEWFRDLTILRGVPFSYIVPDERMLPAESLRFFQIDSQWVQCLLDGAFSIGRVLKSDHSRDAAHLSGDLRPATRASGFLLRSTVVSGWPDILVDGYDRSDSPLSELRPLSKLREEKLSPGILLCLFENVVQEIDIHQKPEALHFGLSVDDKNKFTRTLRDKKGQPSQHQVNVPVSEDGIVGWQELIRNITNSRNLEEILWETPVTSALLAYQLIEGVELVQFAVKSKSSIKSRGGPSV